MRLNSIAYAETARAQWLGLLGAAVLLGSCSGCHGIERLIVGPRVDNEHPTQLRLIWHTATEASPVSYWFGQPALDNGKLFVEDANGIPTVYAIAVADGRLLWKKNVGQGWTFAGHVMGIAESGDTIYVNVWRFLTLNGYLSQGVLVALDRRNGSELWRYESPDTASGFHFPPAVSGRLIVVSDLQGGRTLGLDRFTQQLLWTVPHHTNSTPVMSATPCLARRTICTLGRRGSRPEHYCGRRKRERGRSLLPHIAPAGSSPTRGCCSAWKLQTVRTLGRLMFASTSKGSTPRRSWPMGLESSSLGKAVFTPLHVVRSLKNSYSFANARWRIP